ncbi:MAG TPA: hypothetical protein DCG71_05175 [Brevundimonas sp.]|nr:hypothetical protein [Brevundimonas sp.]
MSKVVSFPNIARAPDLNGQKMANSRDRSLAISVIMPRLMDLLEDSGEVNERGIRYFTFGNGNRFNLMASGEFWLTNKNYYTVFSGMFVPKQGLINPAQYPKQGVTIKTWLRESWQNELFA